VKALLIVSRVRWRQDERLFFPVPVENCLGWRPGHGNHDEGFCVSKAFWWREPESRQVSLKELLVKLASVSAIFDFPLQFGQMARGDNAELAAFRG
jgi:hypothetical protein